MYFQFTIENLFNSTLVCTMFKLVPDNAPSNHQSQRYLPAVISNWLCGYYNQRIVNPSNTRRLPHHAPTPPIKTQGSHNSSAQKADWTNPRCSMVQQPGVHFNSPGCNLARLQGFSYNSVHQRELLDKKDGNRNSSLVVDKEGVTECSKAGRRGRGKVACSGEQALSSLHLQGKSMSWQWLFATSSHVISRREAGGKGWPRGRTLNWNISHSPRNSSDPV
jgi:hypothetical protein